MTTVAEHLASATDSPPVQRVRTYHLTGGSVGDADHEPPQPRDFLAAMRATDGQVCVRWPGPPGDRVVRYVDGHFERVEWDQIGGRTTVVQVAVDRVRGWLLDSTPELVALDDLREAFDSGESLGAAEPPDPDRPAPDSATTVGATPPPESPAELATATDESAGTPVQDDRERSRPGTGSRGRPADGAFVEAHRATGEQVTVGRYGDLLADPVLDAADADALAATLPADADHVAFWLPRPLAAETVLTPVSGSDQVFVGERALEHETERAYYVRQGRAGGWIPKEAVRVYELGESMPVDVSDRGEPRESVRRESAR